MSSVFPGAGAQVYYNEAGEPLGWDYPSEPDEADLRDEMDERWFDYEEDEPDEWIEDDPELPYGTYVRSDRFRGIALYIAGCCGDRVQVVMVGDDRRHELDRDEVEALPREDFCGSCGQIGCGHDGLDRE